ncbi:hypothetical protein L842_2112 [Mycobacterium intracellulare MIN_052511_1280]|nr:hypothetical protein L842_2112 [Mycobacterium intracellulare MIN_052511_1280]
MGGRSSETASDTDAASSCTLMRVVRSPDSGGDAFGWAAELVQSTAATSVCLFPSIITVVLVKAGVELGGLVG